MISNWFNHLIILYFIFNLMSLICVSNIENVNVSRILENQKHYSVKVSPKPWGVSMLRIFVPGIFMLIKIIKTQDMQLPNSARWKVVYVTLTGWQHTWLVGWVTWRAGTSPELVALPLNLFGGITACLGSNNYCPVMKPWMLSLKLNCCIKRGNRIVKKHHPITFTRRTRFLYAGAWCIFDKPTL